ncbi:MAG: cobalamin biosynthesis protein CbiD [Deltaproteobacteria bacterium]|nr:MAG: cobalamin biosynthesis protein CbiD [Deltaproteobacteria bacterium]
MRRPLRHGFTTGACAAAAAKGAALLLRDQRPVETVELPLPAGIAATFPLRGQRFDARSAACCVVKDAGDDPDVTNGCEVWAQVSTGGGEGEDGNQVIITGGAGIGRVTKPGLAVAVGEWAINPVPRRMISEAVQSVFANHGSRISVHVTVSIPDGEERARRTLNARLGIVGGLSILGTTGVVTPISHQAWTDTIDAALGVALASGCTRVLASTGRSSEAVAERQVALPEEAFILMGDHVGHLAAACARRGVAELVVAAQFAKLVKIACGHPQTHAAVADLDLAALTGWARAAGLDAALIERLEWAHTARELYLELGPHHPLMALVAARAIDRLEGWAPGVRCGVLLAGYAGEPAVTFGEPFGAREP